MLDKEYEKDQRRSPSSVNEAHAIKAHLRAPSIIYSGQHYKYSNYIIINKVIIQVIQIIAIALASLCNQLNC